MKSEMVVGVVIICLFLSFCSRFSAEGLPDKGIAVLSPKASDVLQKGTSYEIQWKIEGSDPEFGEMVTVEFSKDAGKSWKQVEENIPKAGPFVWKVPGIDSSQCKVRVFTASARIPRDFRSFHCEIRPLS
jgi:hypothetical protein